MGKSKISEAKREVAVFSLASFFNDLGSDMIKPIWPFFITTYLGLDALYLGLIDGFGYFIEYSSQVLSGYLSDRWKKYKSIVVLGYLMSGLSRIGYALSNGWFSVFVSHVLLDRFGKIRDAPRDAYVSIHTKKLRGASFGLLRSMDNLGAVMGILITFFVFDHVGYRNLFLLAAIPSLISAGLVFGFVRERSLKRKRENWDIRSILSNRTLLIYFISVLLLGLSMISRSFFLLYAKQLGFSIGDTTLFYLIMILPAIVLGYPIGRLIDYIKVKHDEKTVSKSFLLVGYTIYLIFLLGLMSVKDASMLWIIFPMYGVFYAMHNVSYRVLLSNLSTEDYRGTTYGMYRLLLGVSMSIGIFLAGVLWHTFGPYAMFMFAISCAMLSIGILAFV